jgi:hypothetical protein
MKQVFGVRDALLGYDRRHPCYVQVLKIKLGSFGAARVVVRGAHESILLELKTWPTLCHDS